MAADEWPACEGPCRKERRADLARRCCALRILRLWAGQPDLQQGILSVIEARIGQIAQLAADVAAYEADGWPQREKR